jgi:DNA adenine methylase
MVTALTPPLKWHGGKRYLTREIVSRMPRHLHYVEPFAGSLKVLLARDPDDDRLWLPPHKGVSEVVNDLDGRLMNFWRVLADDNAFPKFCRRVEAIPLAREAWRIAKDHAYGLDPMADAVAFFVCCRQSLAGRMNGFTALTRNRTRRRRNGNVSEWMGAVEGLSEVHARLWGRVVFENMPAVRLIEREDEPGTLFYCDPPYMNETRTARKVYGQFEMTEADHQRLLDVLCQCKGKVMLSGYACNLYDQRLSNWDRHTVGIPNHASGAKKKRRMAEVLWCNF